MNMQTAADMELVMLKSHVAALEELLEVQERTVLEQSQRLELATKEALASSAAKASFLANMSHEIRTPMNAVIGMTSLLLDTQLDATQRDYVETVRASGDHLLTVINDILDFSKIESGKLNLENVPFDLRACLEASFDLILGNAAAKRLELVFVLDDKLPQTFEGDVGRLRQILVNLLNNAVKFTAAGQVVVRVTGSDSPSGWELHFAVADTGIGIPQDRMSALFRSFSQVDSSTTRIYGGTGLGLAISKLLAELMGGRIWVESAPGVGSTFHFTVVMRAIAGPVTVTVRSGANVFDGLRALIVDDIEVNRVVLEQMLRTWGMEAVCVPSGARALEQLQDGSFAVAILDYQMPEMDGLTLATAIRSMHSDRMPIVILSSQHIDAEALRSVRVDTVLTKPVKQAHLYERLRRLLGAQGAAPQKHISAPAPIVPPLSLRILVAEDNSVNQKVAVHTLARLGYRADAVGNGIEVLAALEKRAYDVILMDVQMPEMDGLETTRRIRSRWNENERPRVIAVTANAMEGDRESCVAAGMDDYVAKPFRPETLAATLKNCGTVRRA
jgi:signal transduction histidine kinase/DNA-binding response OmpR family regulator